MKSLLLGLDAFSPAVFEPLADQGKLPHLGSFVSANRYRQFEVTNPPQSEVSWTSIATGQDPGGHGMFDFVHREPKSYSLVVSLLPTGKTMMGTGFVPPFNARTLFQQAVDDGYPATALWWPAFFPARPQSPVRTVPGLGTPDIHGRLGVGLLFSNDPAAPDKMGKTPVVKLKQGGKGFSADFPGPIRNTKQGARPSTLPFNVTPKGSDTLQLQVGKQTLTLRRGEWSPIVQLPFKMGRFLSTTVITRFIATHVGSEIRIYSLPLQLHPMKSPWHYATPRPFVKKLWQHSGPFLTLGWPQDTVGLEDGCITDDQFLALCDSIFDTRAAILMSLIDQYKEGVLASVFDSLDRIQHMFWETHPDVIESWYIKLDGLVGQVKQRLQATGNGDTKLVVVSDHGFAKMKRKVNLNRWLIDNDYLSSPNATNEAGFSSVKWDGTKAYAIGLNSLYINRTEREGKGTVSPDELERVRGTLRDQLLNWRDVDGQQVVDHVFTQEEAFSGSLTSYGPDLVIGYAPGYRASAETGMGGWGTEQIIDNNDHWHGDHCMSAAAVPGVIFATRGLENLANPSYRDMPALLIGKNIDGSDAAPPPLPEEDQEIVEQRLKDLGYL